MVEEQKQKLEQEISKLINDLDSSYIRRMQKEMHNCSARCCDDMSLSLEGVQRCIESCSNNLNSANNIVQKELQHFQNGLQRCVMDCNDDIRYKMGDNPTFQDQEKFTKIFENCATKCVDKYLGMVPSLIKNIKASLNKLETGS